jgi:hypothetical protein
MRGKEAKENGWAVSVTLLESLHDATRVFLAIQWVRVLEPLRDVHLAVVSFCDVIES